MNGSITFFFGSLNIGGNYLSINANESHPVVSGIVNHGVYDSSVSISIFADPNLSYSYIIDHAGSLDTKYGTSTWYKGNKRVQSTDFPNGMASGEYRIRVIDEEDHKIEVFFTIINGELDVALPSVEYIEDDVIYINDTPMVDGGIYSAHSPFSVEYKGESFSSSAYREYKYFEDFQDINAELDFSSEQILGGSEETIYDITVNYKIGNIDKSITVTIYYFTTGTTNDLIVQETRLYGTFNRNIPYSNLTKDNITSANAMRFASNLYSYVEGPVSKIYSRASLMGGASSEGYFEPNQNLQGSGSHWFYIRLGDGTYRLLTKYIYIGSSIPYIYNVANGIVGEKIVSGMTSDNFKITFSKSYYGSDMTYTIMCSYNDGPMISVDSGDQFSNPGEYRFVFTSSYFDDYEFTVVIDRACDIVNGIENGLYINEVDIPTVCDSSAYYTVDVTYNNNTTNYTGTQFADLGSFTEEGTYVIKVKDWENNVIVEREIFVADKIDTIATVVKDNVLTPNDYNSAYASYVIAKSFEIKVVNEYVDNVILDGYSYEVQDFNNIESFSYGIHNLKIIDRKGSELELGFIVDTQGPTIMISKADIASYYTDNEQPIKFTDLSDEYLKILAVRLEVNDVLKAENIPSSDLRIAYGEGEYRLTCFDALRNSTTFEFFIDTIAPNIIESQEEFPSSLTLQFSDESSGIATATLTKGDIVINVENGQTINNPGDYTLTVVDNAGHSSTYSFTIYEEQVELGLTGESENSVYLTATVSYIDDYEIIEQALYKIGNGEFQTFVNETVFELEGEYTVKLIDKYDRETILEFEVSDRTKPQGNLRGVVNGGATNNDVSIDWVKSGISATVSFNSATPVSYDRGTKLTEQGAYVVVLTNLAGLTSEFSFTIDKAVSVTINIPNRVTTNESVKITSAETLTIEAYFNEESFDYELGTLLDKDGAYYFVLTDSCNNTETIEFSIVKKPKQDFSYHCPEGYTITQFTLNDQELNINSDGNLALTEDGIYKIAIRSNVDNTITYTYTVTIDTIAPTIELAGLGENSVAKNSVKLAAPSEPLYSFRVLKDGAETNYEPGDLIRENGEYTVELEDMGGNRTVVEFSVNKQIEPIFMIGGAVTAVAILGFAIAIGSLRRKRMSK